MTTPTETITIENVVGSTGIDQELDLEQLGEDLTGVKYDPEQFPGLVYRTQDPNATALIFRSGKIVCTGANSEEEVRESLSIVSETLRELGIEVTETPPIEIQNIVASVDFGTRFNLNAIAIGLGLEDVEYEPEQFPGLVYRLEDPSAVALLFGSGKAVITGAKTTDAVAHTTNAVETRLTDLGLFQ
ncbi:TATA-box-binding protein [Halostagnicola kamekurae]|uniref:TATA-box-binding protein n=1 Tax=Halostagnicola kamekurae TaxID=619731 RepID=A0A1I6V024_9EURY|nr:TATA-box-binding protein [Halostagnicola kamekurae]SFT06994.1 TATA binding protein of transcription factor TFIID [Halostagnicola kamekurae]